MQSKVALVIVFNHRFDSNIEKLEKIYKGRFSNIYYLVPFYNGSCKNVIPVYESSYYFQGYLAQGFKYFFKEEYEHYFFIADDLILNPSINENNYQQHFGLSAEDSFIPEVYSLHNINNNILDCYPVRLKDCFAKLGKKKVEKWNWCRVYEAYMYDPQKNGVESVKELPVYDEAIALLKRHGITIHPLQYADVFGGPKKPESLELIRKNIAYVFGQEIMHKNYHLKYPLAGAYSDIVIVSHQSIQKFIHYCGVFAATELFVELAIPTALLFATTNVITEVQLNKNGSVFWPFTKERKQLYETEMQKFDYSVEKLISDFPHDKLYIHPIKLSKWQMNLN